MGQLWIQPCFGASIVPADHIAATDIAHIPVKQF